MFLGAALAQCSGRNSGGRGAGREVPAAQPRKEEGCPGPPDADYQGEGGRFTAH